MNHSNAAFTHTKRNPECNNVSVMKSALCPTVKKWESKSKVSKRLTTTKSRETELKVSDWIFSLSKKVLGSQVCLVSVEGNLFVAACRQMKTACQCWLWAVQDVRHTELSWLVWSLFAGSTTHVFAFGCGCDFCRKVHQCWTCKATVQICFPTGCKCIVCPFAVAVWPLTHAPQNLLSATSWSQQVTEMQRHVFLTFETNTIYSCIWCE